MSNPLATFRKNRNFWMAGLVLLAIMAFIVAPAIEYLTQGARGDGTANVVVVSWDGGKVRMGDLQVAVQKHARFVRFLTAVAKRVIDAGGQPRVPGFAYDPQRGQIFALGIQTSSREIDVCRTRILATHAAKLGIEFSDSSADDFLTSFCDDRLTSEEIEELLRDSTDSSLTFYDVRELLKEEMAAMLAAQLAESGVGAYPPGRTWSDFLKFNQTAKVEAFPIFVEDFVGKVAGSPTEAEIQEIFEKGIKQVSNPNSPEPGFVRRHHANVEYVQADLQVWTNREKEKLTEEQLRAEYDRRLSLGQLKVPANLPISPATETPATETPATETPATETPATETPATESATEPPAAETADEPATSDQSSRKVLSGSKLVSFVQDTETPPAVVQPPQLGEAGTTEATATADAENADANQTVEEDAAAGVGQAVPNAPQEMRNQTFEEARDRIANDLAREQAIPKLDEALTNLVTDVMMPHYTAHRAYRAIRDAAVDTGEKNDPPIKPNVKKYAEDNGLVYGETGMVDGVAVGRTPFGLSNIRQESDQSGPTGMVANVVMSPYVELFRPTQSSYFDQAALMQGKDLEFLQFVFWKTDERQLYVPDLAEVRAEVIEYWKQTKARELANTAAKKLAKEVGSTATDPWKAALSSAEQALVIQTDPFSWMTRYADQPGISTVPKMDAVGGEFMESVFNTPVGQTGVGANENKRVYYVFRVSEKGPNEEDLQQRFNADPLKSGPMSLARQDSQEMLMDWYQSVEKDLDVVWEIPLEQLTSNE